MVALSSIRSKDKIAKIKPRIIETDEGIQGDFNVTTYDKMQRRLRNKGWIETNRIIAFGIETAMDASCAEWWHLAQEWSKEYKVLVYDRMGLSFDIVRSCISK